MFRMKVVVWCLCLFCAVSSAVAEDHEACVRNMDGTCAMEEGLQMLQSKPAKIQRHGETSADKPSKEDQKNTMEKEKGNATKDTNKSRPEYEFEKELLADSDIEKIRFRARHQNWVDILDLYKDGFLKRYHDHDAGTWHLNHEKKLVFNWLRWGAEEATMETTDKGKTFNSSNQVKFYLKSYVQPLWWRNQFDGSNEASLLEESKKESKKEIFADTKQIIRAHADGSRADLDEAGYLAVAMLKDDDEMRTYIHRLSESMGLQIVKEGGVSGLLPYYSGSSTYQTLQKLKAELTKAVSKKKGVRWILHQDDPQLALLQEDDPALALLQVTHRSSSKKHSSKDAESPDTHYKAKAMQSKLKDDKKHSIKEAESPDTHYEVKAKQSKKLQEDIENSGTLLKERSESELKAQAAAQKAMQERLDKQQESENERLENERAMAEKEKQRLRHEEQKAKARREEEKYKESERILKENKKKNQQFKNKDKEPRHVGYFLDDGTWKDMEDSPEAAKPLKHLPHHVGRFLENGNWEEAQTLAEENNSSKLALLQATNVVHKESPVEETHKMPDASSKKASHYLKTNHKEEIELELELLQESDIEKVRFRAKHDDWFDILDLYKDGFFRRYHDGDLGIWHKNGKNQLVLKWLKWGEEELRSLDDGKSFNGAGKGNFTMKSYKQPVWWRKTFDASSNAQLQELSQESKKSKGSKPHADMMTIIGAHVNGQKAELTERGYEVVALQKNHKEMMEYIRRVAKSMNMNVVNDGGLNGIVPYYSGELTYQTLEKLKSEIMTEARKPAGERWVMDEGGDDPTHAF